METLTTHPQLLISPWLGFLGFLSKATKEKEIVFYSRGAHDFIHMEPLIRELQKSYPQKICYLTSSWQDTQAKDLLGESQWFFIGEGLARSLSFQWMHSKMLISSIPDLGRFALKKSLYGVHYVYLFHSLCSTHMIYRENAFGAYDTILCGGPHQYKELQRLHQIQQRADQKIIPYGYGWIDTLIKKKKPSVENPVPQILIAPTWGEQSIFNLCLIELIDALSEAPFKIVLQPHPMTLKQERSQIKQVQLRYHRKDHVQTISHPSQSVELSDFDLLISDWSGIAMEFAFSQLRPVLFIDVPRKIKNPSFEDLSIQPLEISIREKIGKVIAMEDLSTVSSQVHRLLAQMSAYEPQIKEVRKQSVYHLGESAYFGSLALGKILQAS